MNEVIKQTDVLDIHHPERWVFESVTIGDEPSYLVYTPADNDPDGRFEMEDGGLVWFSKLYPAGEPCKTRVITKEEGDMLLTLLGKHAGKQNKIENTSDPLLK